jgi:hypothetical protein
LKAEKQMKLHSHEHFLLTLQNTAKASEVVAPGTLKLGGEDEAKARELVVGLLKK